MGVEALRERFLTWSNEHVRTRTEWLHTCNPLTVRTSFEGFANDDIHFDSFLVDVPAWLMTAPEAQVVLDDDIAEWRQLVPHMLINTVNQAGHLIPMGMKETSSWGLVISWERESHIAHE